MNVKIGILFIVSLLCGMLAWSGEVPIVPKSTSPDARYHAVMDIDRDARIFPEWKEGSFPQIEITDRVSGKVLTSIEYFGEFPSDLRPLREHVLLNWRADSKAFSVTIHDRNYSNSRVYAYDKEQRKFIEVKFPSYREMTGYAPPKTEQLRPRGRTVIDGWDDSGEISYIIMLSPLPTFSGKDPLNHRIRLKVDDEKKILTLAGR